MKNKARETNIVPLELGQYNPRLLIDPLQTLSTVPTNVFSSKYCINDIQ